METFVKKIKKLKLKVIIISRNGKMLLGSVFICAKLLKN